MKGATAMNIYAITENASGGFYVALERFPLNTLLIAADTEAQAIRAFERDWGLDWVAQNAWRLDWVDRMDIPNDQGGSCPCCGTRFTIRDVTNEQEFYSENEWVYVAGEQVSIRWRDLLPLAEDGPPLVPEVDEVLERLLAEEEEIERRARTEVLVLQAYKAIVADVFDGKVSGPVHSLAREAAAAAVSELIVQGHLNP